MTIFGEVARKVIHERVRAACVASSDADVSTTTTFFSQIGLGRIGFARDLSLSKAKRDLIEKLLPDIDKSTGSADDEIVCEHFQTLIRHCKTETLNKANSNSTKFGKGTTEPVLDKLIMILQTIFDKLTELNLLNISHDQDPLNSFRYHVALYYAKKIAADSEASGWDINLAKKIELTTEQDKFVVRAISTCTKHINKIDADKKQLEQLLGRESSQQDDLEHKEMRRSQIALSVSWLQRHNNEVCQRFTPAPIPGLTYFDPNDSILTECLDEAVTAIGDFDCAPKPVFQEQAPTLAIRLVSPEKMEASTDTSSEQVDYIQSPVLRVVSQEHTDVSIPISSVSLEQSLTPATPAPRLVSPEKIEIPVVQELIKQSSISEAASAPEFTAAEEEDIDSTPQQSKSSIDSITVKPAASAPWPSKAQKKAQRNQAAAAEPATAMRKPF